MFPKFKLLFFLIFVNGCILSVSGQAKNKKDYLNPKDIMDLTEYESFNIEPYKDKIDPFRNLISYDYTLKDGTAICVYWEEGFGAQIDETPPKPYFYRVMKRFNADGSLIEKGAYISNTFGCKIGKWLECDKNGHCKVVDYEDNRGRFGYKQVLEFLEKKKQINLRTGQGRESIAISYSYENTCWTVGTKVPGTYIRIEYILDGNTGKILDEKETVDEV